MNKIELQGENKRFLESKVNRKLLVGPAAVGKSYTGMMLIHLACIKYPGTKVLLARKCLPPLRNSLFKTYEQVVEDTDCRSILRTLGDIRSTQVIYNNSANEIDGEIYSGISEIVLSSIDPHSKLIGAEYDIVYIHEPACEGLTFDDFMLVTSRAKNSNMPYRQVIAEGSLPVEKDGERNHWLWTLPERGFEVFNPTIKDNPEMYGLTERGKTLVNSLNLLPDYLKESQLVGEWRLD